jgi:hypothetical protein
MPLRRRQFVLAVLVIGIQGFLQIKAVAADPVISLLAE